jgi:endonuclease YncB( thermonuclease family)
LYLKNYKTINDVIRAVQICTLALISLLYHIDITHAQQRSYKVVAQAIDSHQLQTKDGVIKIWGISNALENKTADFTSIKAKLFLDELIGRGELSCVGLKREQGRIIARCNNSRNQDLALELLKAGFALTQTGDIRNTPYEAPYTSAQREARKLNIGVWSAITAAEKYATQSDQNDGALYAKDILLIASAFLGPIIGMMIIATIMYFGLDRMIKLQKRQIALSQQREKDLRDREKFVLAASLESEINTNRAKIEAFLVIYEDMLRNMKDTATPIKYQQSGDVIHQRPSLSRAIYDANVDRMDLLGGQLFADLSDIYALINTDPDYTTLEPDTPIEQAIDKVQKVIRQANDLITPLDQVGSAIGMIIRERKKKAPQTNNAMI